MVPYHNWRKKIWTTLQKSRLLIYVIQIQTFVREPLLFPLPYYESINKMTMHFWFQGWFNGYYFQMSFLRKKPISLPNLKFETFEISPWNQKVRCFSIFAISISGPAEWGGLPGLVPVIFETLEDFYNDFAMKKVKSRWF